jgi:hypothetical protein
MANALYRQSGSAWLRQDGGGPAYFQIRFNPSDSLWYVYFTYNGSDWFWHDTGYPDAPTAQTNLNAYITKLNAGTA